MNGGLIRYKCSNCGDVYTKKYNEFLCGLQEDLEDDEFRRNGELVCLKCRCDYDVIAIMAQEYKKELYANWIDRRVGR